MFSFPYGCLKAGRLSCHQHPRHPRLSLRERQLADAIILFGPVISY